MACEIFVLEAETEPVILAVEAQVLTTEPPGNSQESTF